MTDITIQLEKYRIFAHHGIHKQERAAGAEFEVDVQVRYTGEGMVSSLDQTLDYTQVIEIVRQEMVIATPLLETVAMRMAEAIQLRFPRSAEINITIRKIHPPIRNFRGHLSVSLRKTHP